MMAFQQELDYSRARNALQVRPAMAVALGGLNIGCCALSWSSVVQPQILHDGNETNNSSSIWSLQLDSDEMSWIGSVINVGALIGSILGAFLMDILGRRKSILASYIPNLIGWITVTMAVDYNMMYAGRVILGISIGALSVISPCYIVEMSTPPMRGIVGTFFAVNICCGMWLANALAWADWRWISCILGISSHVLFLAVYFVPESPYFLMKNRNLGGAENSLSRLRGPRFDVLAELEQLESRILLDRAYSLKLPDLLSRWILMPIVVSTALVVFLPFSGIIAGSPYSARIFELAGIFSDSRLGSLVFTSVQVLAALFSSILLMERFGRRTLFVISQMIVCLSLFLLGGYFYLYEQVQETGTKLGWLSLFAILIFAVFLNIGTMSLPWLILAEILPGKIKTAGVTIATCSYWLASFAIAKTFNSVHQDFNESGLFWFYGFFCFVGFLFGLAALPETKGKTLNELQALFRRIPTLNDE